MHSRRLQTALTKFLEAAASHLQAEIDAGAEIPFELGSRTGRSRRGATPLYCYRALTGEFIAEREGDLQRLPGYAQAAKLLDGFEGLDSYLQSVGTKRGGASPVKGTPRAANAMRALLEDAFDEQTDFELRPERLEAALGRLERSVLQSPGEVTLVATLHGLTITSEEVSLTKGLTLAHPDALQGIPDAVGSVADSEWPGDHLVVLLTVSADGDPDPQAEAPGLVAQGREVLDELLRTLRLFGDGRVALGALAWARIGEGAWRAVALGTGGRPHGMLVVTPEQEDELRAFCSLVSRRAPHRNELAWALRRFELGCARESPYEALSDHLLALRALLEPEGPASGLLARRLAALCATPENRAALTERMVAASELERAVIAGSKLKGAGREALVAEVADHLRALLRDVICGHLTPDLGALADELLLVGEDDDPVDPVAAGQEHEPSGQQTLVEPAAV